MVFMFFQEQLQLLSLFWLNLFCSYILLTSGEKQIFAAEVGLIFPRWGWESWEEGECV